MPADDAAGLARLRSWFRAYVAAFCTRDPGAAPVYRMKAAHTGRVRLGMRRLAAEAGLSGRALALAETAGLLHDAGRFEQYERYRTFRDGESEHHGRLAVQVIRTQGLLQDMPAAERRIVLGAVAHHNEARLRPLADPAALFLLKLLRDADKLDILKMAAARTNGRPRPGPLTDLNVPADGPCSPPWWPPCRPGVSSRSRRSARSATRCSSSCPGSSTSISPPPSGRCSRPGGSTAWRGQSRPAPMRARSFGKPETTLRPAPHGRMRAGRRFDFGTQIE